LEVIVDTNVDAARLEVCATLMAESPSARGLSANEMIGTTY